MAQHETPSARLRSLRRAHGWSQQELAQRTGVSHSMISLFERGGARPGMRTIRKLALAFERTPADLALYHLEEPNPIDDQR